MIDLNVVIIHYTNAIFVELLKRIKKTKKVEKTIRGDTEIYRLDNIDIFFCGCGTECNTTDIFLRVKSKSGEKLCDINCKRGHDITQILNNKYFYDLLNYMRDSYEQRHREQTSFDKKILRLTCIMDKNIIRNISNKYIKILQNLRAK